MKVHDRVPRAHQKGNGGKIIGVRWVDVNKGDETNKDYRSRRVGQEFATHRDDALYASTPPLEAFRVILSFAASGEGANKRHIMICDVRRAYFYAQATRDLYIDLPEEDDQATPGQLGKLNLSLYGTRDAANNRQEHLSRHLVSIGFVRGTGHTSVYHHPQRRLMVLVHGDDICSRGRARRSEVA